MQSNEIGKDRVICDGCDVLFGGAWPTVACVVCVGFELVRRSCDRLRKGGTVGGLLTAGYGGCLCGCGGG